MSHAAHALPDHYRTNWRKASEMELLNHIKREDKDAIDAMTHEEQARIFRFAMSHCRIIRDHVLYEYFCRSFNRKGGMTTKMSKLIGFKNTVPLHPMGARV
jgi:hypothetical protein